MVVRNNSDAVWEQLGKTDPYSAIVAHTSRTGFFESGEQHVAALLKIVRDQLSQEYEPVRGLDFGCGVGRVLIPLAAICREVVGVDISDAMRAEARRNCEERGLTNVELVTTVDQLAERGTTFDLVHTYIVLQHIPRGRGMAILSRLIDLVAPGGIGALHVQYFRETSTLRKFGNRVRVRVPLSRGLANVIQRKPWQSPLMEMNVYPLDDVLRTLQLRQCHNVVLRFTTTDTGGYLGVMVIFRKEARNLTSLE